MLHVKCCHDRHNPILLPDRVSVILGRSPQTKIPDKGCSRQQIQLIADYENGTVTLKQLGVNPSRYKNHDVAKGESKILKVGDVFCFFADQYPHEIIKSLKPVEKNPQKRTIDSFFGPNQNSAIEQDSKKPKMAGDDYSKIESQNSDDETEIAKKLKLLKGKDSSLRSKQLKPPEGQIQGREENKWEKSATDPGWTDHSDMMVYHSANSYNSSKIAAFDMDGTLITTASGRTFAQDHNDWKILYAEVPGRLKKLHREGYKIVIITNQLGIGKGKIKPKDFQTKVGNILKKIGVPAQVIAITRRGPNRKPNLGSWAWLVEDGNGSVRINMEESFYIGDAAGRPKDWAPKKKKDFSCTDRLFALNLGLEFKTPEEFFLSQKPVKFSMPEFDPKSIENNNILMNNSNINEIVTEKQEVVIMVGFPASGKSFFCKEYLVSRGYVHVNRDNMKTWQKCVAACNQALANGKSVVIDNTNPDSQSRKRYIDCAKLKGYDCRCFVMQVSIDHARHNNRFRELSNSDHDKVPDMVFYQYRKSYEEPKLEEGFSSIVKVNFVPKFANDEMKKKYHMYTD